MHGNLALSDEIAIPLVLGIASVILLLLLIGSVQVIRDTIRRKGGWGINTRPLFCPECGEPAPPVRIPRNLDQALWGGCTCDYCDCEYDKWGVNVSPSSPYTPSENEEVES